MKYFLIPIVAICLLCACTKRRADAGGRTAGYDHIAMVTNINTGTTPVAYLGTRSDFSKGTYNNANARQVVSYALAQVYGNDVYLIEARSGDKVKKYTRNMDGTLQEAGSLVMPAASFPYCIAFESAVKAYVSLGNTGKIAVINPATMTQTGLIDLTPYALGDASPDPGVMVYKNGRLYVACLQTSDGYTSMHPAQVLVIDVAGNYGITSITDNRATYAGNASSSGSMFFTENGDLYVLCMSSWGFVPGQKCGFLRIKNGDTKFDPAYFFNISDYVVANIPGSHLDYLHRVEYAGNGIVYATGNIPKLMSNPPDYVKDKTFGAFRADLQNKVLTKLDIPYSNGYAACVLPYENKVYYGMSTNTGVGIFSFDPATNTTSVGPVVSAQGDPSILCAFE
ncbi:hypothetical protein EGT74_24180 [Chitinophaga lutea]|uniref:Lipoprotein n=1 Tax=Chitinophaga lutea TaxID=2488634 RepID=A0A3N4PB65_9BACT|nr:hypothetical protein [Chitinophaga lutea]RPE05486.1 hypothetical protein EGT74_24180 [Chitinophaga lutea]